LAGTVVMLILFAVGFTCTGVSAAAAGISNRLSRLFTANKTALSGWR